MMTELMLVEGVSYRAGEWTNNVVEDSFHMVLLTSFAMLSV